jgi:hypothetical protein
MEDAEITHSAPCNGGLSKGSGLPIESVFKVMGPHFRPGLGIPTCTLLPGEPQSVAPVFLRPMAMVWRLSAVLFLVLGLLSLCSVSEAANASKARSYPPLALRKRTGISTMSPATFTIGDATNLTPCRQRDLLPKVIRMSNDCRAAFCVLLSIRRGMPGSG